MAAQQQVSKELLRARFVGKTLHQVPTPAVVLDLAKVEANCNMMLDAARRLGLGWRAHIKTHKTTELTRLQVGDNDDSPVNIVVSTVLEAESVIPLLKEYREAGRRVNVLYSFPIYGSCVDRLSDVSAQLGPGGLTVMVDHVDQVKHLTALASKSGNRPLVFLKVDMGSHRAGVIPETPECAALIEQLLLSETVGSSLFYGLYCHAAHSYATREDWAAMGLLAAEFQALQRVASAVRPRQDHNRPLVLSVGATPTATSLQHPGFAPASMSAMSPISPVSPTVGDEAVETEETLQIRDLIRSLQGSGHEVEVHAGVYPTLDLQQLATHSRDGGYLNPTAIGITVLTEVASIYPGRGPPISASPSAAPTDEALVNAGCLALGREPCEDRGEVKGRHYSGWGIVTPWNKTGNPPPGRDFPARHGGWQVGKISQEHGILRWIGGGGDDEIGGDGDAVTQSPTPLHVGQRVRIWPNHACIAGAGHGWYLVVDSRNRGREDEVVDVWPRWNGW